VDGPAVVAEVVVVLERDAAFDAVEVPDLLHNSEIFDRDIARVSD
jgi:hypothetical protein